MTGTTKKCWTCSATTPYEVGWCDNCIQEIPADIVIAVYGAETEPFAGLMRLAVSEALQMQRRKRPKEELRKNSDPGRINLDDLEI